jgi:hypothetical protein
MNKQGKSTSKPRKAESPDPQAGLCSVDPLGECPQEKPRALEWIVKKARQMGADCCALYRDWLFRHPMRTVRAYFGRDNVPDHPSGTRRNFPRPGARELKHDESLQVWGRLKRAGEVYAAIEKFIPSFAPGAFRAHCRNVDVVSENVSHALKEYERLEVEAGKRVEACEDRRGTTPEGDWSKPLSKTDIMACLRIDSLRKFNAFAKRQGIQQAGNRQTWRLRMDGLTESEKHRLREK